MIGPRTLSIAISAWAVGATAGATDLDAEPVRYGATKADNVVERLAARLNSGKAKLEWDDKTGRLKALLRELGVSETSQTLVFSKTSFQLRRIAPASPRAIYFGDDVYIGFCQDGDVLELSAADPKLGTVFYSMDQSPDGTPTFRRQSDSCLICHASSRNQGIPGHLVRSVYVDREGYPILSAGGHRVDHTVPFELRWGGWYVTGTHGKQAHLGNLVLADRNVRPSQVDNREGLNVTDLSDRIRTGPYLNGHSDIVALLVLEHQSQMHSLIARATLLTRFAIHDETVLNRELGKPVGHRWESTGRRIKDAGEPVVRYLLFSEEAKLTDTVKGTSGFAEHYAKQGPRDSRGRSLRDLDLKTRLLKHPCSPLVHSEVFDAMPDEVKQYVYKRVWEVLTGRDRTKEFAHLSDGDRRNVLEILRATKSGLPEYWKGN